VLCVGIAAIMARVERRFAIPAHRAGRLSVLDVGVIVSNFQVPGRPGLSMGGFAGGTLRRRSRPSAGFVLGIFIGVARLARSRWINLPATLYVEFFRGVPLVMVIFWIGFIIRSSCGSDPGVRSGSHGVRDLRGRVLRRDRPGRHSVRPRGQSRRRPPSG